MFLIATSAFAQTTLQPQTTLANETANNTSAANTFSGQTNGNLPAGNISKMPIRSLLYAGATTKIYAHLMPWFGSSSHVNVGYDSADPAQAARQVADMASRGIDGAIVDWYGPNSTHHNTATKNVLNSSERTPNFEFAICEDYGAVRNSTDPTQQTISDLNYAWQTFMQSPAYMRRNSRPVVFFFGFEGQAADLNVVKSSLTFNPLFIMRNSGGFSASMSDGSFGWLAPLTSGYDSYMSLPYLDNFYSTAVRYPGDLTFGSGFKGFNDTLASWAPPGGRHIQQYCGQTWISSFAEAGTYYSANNQLAALQVVTWNDYEEGTAIEPGIDNCVSITAWTAGTSLNWAITGQESTLDHYTVFASADGSNLAKIGDYPTGTSSVDLAPLNLVPGSYQFFVKAVGKASIANHISGPVPYSYQSSVQAPTSGSTSADYAVSLTPSSVQIMSGSSGQLTVALSSVKGTYSNSVTLSCDGVPVGMYCSFGQSKLVPGTSGASTAIKISTASPVARNQVPTGWILLPTFGLVGVLGSGLSKKTRIALLCTLGLIIVIVTVGCGANGNAAKSTSVTSSSVAPGTYTITITATSGNLTHTTAAAVIVQ